jgi:hypothetical protein
MLKILIAAQLCLLSLCLYPHLSFLDKKYNYTFQQLALTWPGTFCGESNFCIRDWMSNWDGYCGFHHSDEASQCTDFGQTVVNLVSLI